ncbi:ImmA/IrrE family metallo-endopeptidase [Alkalicoccus urumqiensis]|uniref:IrrE N-terminal-like domain-containing protein n=1 Tax=Alkalicoccus urumqiensis TaxID=1548213 RepID=A0A2P6MJK5_ALKUR|nr:ImmA/IrrE family metallo-endopeptidase [Alkalicoccus urumqiensis]PRO66451.1 hypothetical protein C6I21_03680 [Alkalicoccus urumqiensis]
MNPKEKAEQIAEAFAQDYLEETLGHDIFIGAFIEQLVTDEANVIYHWVEDPGYFGAALTSSENERFIVINTYHPLRMRYFTAAHELWHLTKGSLYAGDDPNFDHERAADRFAAAVMMPKALTKYLWRQFRKAYTPEMAVIHIADMAGVPYKAVARRLQELNEKPVHLKWTEEQWGKCREAVGLNRTPLDMPLRGQHFTAYEKAVNQMVKEQELNKLSAANKLSPYAPALAEQYQQEAAYKDRQNED